MTAREMFEELGWKCEISAHLITYFCVENYIVKKIRFDIYRDEYVAYGIYVSTFKPVCIAKELNIAINKQMEELKELRGE